MRSVLRRLLWLGPALVLITMVTFAALSLALGVDSDGEALPLFFNPQPGAIERVSLRALRAVADPGEPDPAAAAELGRLGGAALPYVLPALDSLNPDARGRVVQALRPVAARMGLEIDPSWEPSREVSFWTRFWEEHSIDYRPVVARRAVLRLVQKSTLLRDAEVRQLDTYALDELIRQLAAVDDAGDVERVRRLSAIALDMLGGLPPSPRGNWQLPPDAGVDAARSVSATWSDWWSRQRTYYRTYSGTERITAMLRDTRYGGWVSQALRHDLGLLDDGRSVGHVLRQGALVSAPLLAGGVAGALSSSALAAAVASLGRRRLTRAIVVWLALRAALPVIVAALIARSLWGGAVEHGAPGALLMLLFGAPLSAPPRAARAERQGADFLRTLQSLGVARWRLALSGARLSSAAIVGQLGAQLSTLITLTFVVELALGLGGLGAKTIEALERPDINWLMAITICTALFVALLQATSELSSALLDPRWREGIERLGGAA